MSTTAVAVSATYHNQQRLEREILFTMPSSPAPNQESILKHLEEIGQSDIIALLSFTVLKIDS